MADQPVQPPPPLMFSTITGWPMAVPRPWARSRAVVSVPPPAAYATIRVSGRSGNDVVVWEAREQAATATGATPAASHERRRIVITRTPREPGSPSAGQPRIRRRKPGSIGTRLRGGVSRRRRRHGVAGRHGPQISPALAVFPPHDVVAQEPIVVSLGEVQPEVSPPGLLALEGCGTQHAGHLDEVAGLVQPRQCVEPGAHGVATGPHLVKALLETG